MCISSGSLAFSVCLRTNYFANTFWSFRWALANFPAHTHGQSQVKQVICEIVTFLDYDIYLILCTMTPFKQTNCFINNRFRSSHSLIIFTHICFGHILSNLYYLKCFFSSHYSFFIDMMVLILCNTSQDKYFHLKHPIL